MQSLNCGITTGGSSNENNNMMTVCKSSSTNSVRHQKHTNCHADEQTTNNVVSVHTVWVIELQLFGNISIT